ncbi:hypothetical protein [Paenibacillus endoradicis]|uniref:hypothetical protein n=1 Tax=Paenibacillus endoradicis TaxID=2972487 RepID=UPI002158C1E7|nr:hypothetical protein [Paenibacillus endoradicis]MCR8658525.1 hypothetical protein [Paenibacillus endoradicis]
MTIAWFSFLLDMLIQKTVEIALEKAPFPQRKALLHLVVKKISLDDKRQVQDVELIFNEDTEKHFLSLAPSAKPMAEGAFPLSGETPKLRYKLNIII